MATMVDSQRLTAWATARSNSIFTNIPVIWRFVVWATDSH
jgi:hypothetical protein